MTPAPYSCLELWGVIGTWVGGLATAGTLFFMSWVRFREDRERLFRDFIALVSRVEDEAITIKIGQLYRLRGIDSLQAMERLILEAYLSTGVINPLKAALDARRIATKVFPKDLSEDVRLLMKYFKDIDPKRRIRLPKVSPSELE